MKKSTLCSSFLGFILGLCVLILLFNIYPYFNKPEGALKCVDGDTFRIGDEYFRLSYIDTPEKGEDGYEKASNFTCKMMQFNKFGLIKHGEDIYGRTLVEVKFASTGDTLNRALISICLAKPYYKNADDNLVLLYYKNCYEKQN